MTMTQLQFNTDLLGIQNKLFYFAMRLTSDQEKARDLLQETSLKALTYREKYSQDTNFNAWIYTIMKNTFINNYRRNKKSRNSLDGSTTDFQLKFEKDKSYPSPESNYNSKEILKSINALEDDYKIPFNMFIDGYKYKEIAENLNLPLGTVKSRIFFSRKKLEKSLKDYK
jgi:RNA polymerase sigma factor (sigma-70 family)